MARPALPRQPERAPARTWAIRVLNVTKRDLAKDLERAAEFDQSALFKRIYEEEYGQLGGKPYGMLVGDYDFGRGAEDVALLKRLSNVAAAAHAPFVANAPASKMMNDGPAGTS